MKNSSFLLASIYGCSCICVCYNVYKIYKYNVLEGKVSYACSYILTFYGFIIMYMTVLDITSVIWKPKYRHPLQEDEQMAASTLSVNVGQFLQKEICASNCSAPCAQSWVPQTLDVASTTTS